MPVTNFGRTACTYVRSKLQQTVADVPLVMVANARPQNSSAFPGISVPSVDFLVALGIIIQS